MNDRFIQMKPILIIASLAVITVTGGIIGGFVLNANADDTSSEANAYHSTADNWPTPTDLQEAVDRADAIVVGTVDRIEGTYFEGPYDSVESSADTAESRSPALPHTYYRLTIQSVLFDDGNIDKAPILRLGGTLGQSNVELGASYVMFLGRNPDNASYGILGSWGLMNVSSADTVRGLDGNRIGFVGSIEAQNLANEVNERIPSKKEWEWSIDVVE